MTLRISMNAVAFFMDVFNTIFTLVVIGRFLFFEISKENLPYFYINLFEILDLFLNVIKKFEAALVSSAERKYFDVKFCIYVVS